MNKEKILSDILDYMIENKENFMIVKAFSSLTDSTYLKYAISEYTYVAQKVSDLYEQTLQLDIGVSDEYLRYIIKSNIIGIYGDDEIKKKFYESNVK